MIRRETIFQYWSKGAQTLKDKESAYEILSVEGNHSIARWQSKFTVIKTGKRMPLDCIFLVKFDDDDRCSLFREWSHLKPWMPGLNYEYLNSF